MAYQVPLPLPLSIALSTSSSALGVAITNFNYTLHSMLVYSFFYISFFMGFSFARAQRCKECLVIIFCHRDKYSRFEFTSSGSGFSIYTEWKLKLETIIKICYIKRRLPLPYQRLTWRYVIQDVLTVGAHLVNQTVIPLVLVLRAKDSFMSVH